MKYFYFRPFDLIRAMLADRDAPLHARMMAARDHAVKLRDDPGARPAMQAAVNWLCLAHDKNSTNDQGVARHFSLISGWGPSYPETTGYIVPTFLDVAALTNDSSLEARATRMLDWLVSIQNADGSFNGGTISSQPKIPVLFNTGQILIGLAAGAARVDERFEAPMIRAAEWMIDAQESDGSWRKHESPFARPGLRTYDAHASIGLFHAGLVSGNAGYIDAATRNIDWTIGKQRSNGWFEDCCVTDDARPLTHTIGYTLRGITEAYRVTSEARYLEAARLGLEQVARRLHDNGFLPGRFDSNWNSCANWSCVTGSLQIAECWLILQKYIPESGFRSAATRVNRFARKLLRFGDEPEVSGAVPGAFPLNGDYNRYEYPNWATKFFIDSHLAEQPTVLES